MNRMILVALGCAIIGGCLPCGCTARFNSSSMSAEVEAPGLKSKTSVPAVDSETTVDPVEFAKYALTNTADVIKLGSTLLGLPTL